MLPGRVKMFLISDFSPSATGATNLPSTFFAILVELCAATVFRYCTLAMKLSFNWISSPAFLIAICLDVSSLIINYLKSYF